MKVIITGSHGAVAPFIIRELEARGIETIIYDRKEHDILSYEDNYNFIKETGAELFLHIATGDLKWIEIISDACHNLGVKMIYTSSVSVFDENGTGPYYPESEARPNTDYGKYKLAGERLVERYKENLIMRLGWQIGYKEGYNNMLDFLISQHKQRGFIGASNLWYPSCSFLIDTADTIVDNLGKQGLYLVNSNSNYTFYQIVCYLNKLFEMNWDVRIENSFGRDDRMIDPRIHIQKINI